MSKIEISREEQPLCSHIMNVIPVEFKTEELTPEIQEAIDYFKNSEAEVTFETDIDGDKFFEALGIKKENNFGRMQYRVSALLNLIEKQQKEIQQHKNTIARYEMECKSFRAFCRKIRKTEKRNVDEFNQGREYSYIQFLNLINGEQNWEHEGKHFNEVDEELEKWLERK